MRCCRYAEPISYEFWQHVRKMVDWVCIHWTETDEGIWEVRGGQQHFVYSKVMAWVALDRGIRLAERRSFPADLPRWQQVRNTIYEEIQEKGWNKKRKAFVQHYGSDTLDASVLIMPLVFFMSPTDPRFVSTLDAILASVADDGLVSNNLVFRYNVETTQDGLVGEEGTFSICTFWACEAAARLGMFKKEYLEKGRLMFEQVHPLSTQHSPPLLHPINLAHSCAMPWLVLMLVVVCLCLVVMRCAADVGLCESPGSVQ